MTMKGADDGGSYRYYCWREQQLKSAMKLLLESELNQLRKGFLNKYARLSCPYNHLDGDGNEREIMIEKNDGGWKD